MQRFKDIHKGKRIWILGAGPSLLDIDFNKIPEDDIIIATNSAIIKQPRFTYACFTDGMINYFKSYRELVNNPCTIISFNELEIAAIKPDTFFIKKSYDKRFTSLETIFTKEDDQVCFGIDIIHCTTHLAFVMGASEIILCGCDCNIPSTKQHHWYNDIPELTDDCPSELRDRYYSDNKSGGWNEAYDYGAELAYWQLIYNNNPSLNIKIASLHSKIPGFPKIYFKDLMSIL